MNAVGDAVAVGDVGQVLSQSGQVLSQKKLGKNLRWVKARGAYYIDYIMDGERFFHSLKTAVFEEAWKARNLELKAAVVAQAQGRLAEFRKIIGGVKEKRVVVQVATIGAVCAEYERAAMRRGSPSAESVRNNISALRLVIRRGLEEDEEERGTLENLGTDVLRPELSRKFAESLLADARGAEEEGRARRSICSILRQARCVFSRDMLMEFEGRVTLPQDLDRWLRFSPVENVAKEDMDFSAGEVEILKAGAELRESNPAVYAAWFLGYHLALRSGEIAQVRREWLRKYEVPGEVPEWLQKLGRSWCWVLDLKNAQGFDAKSPASRGIVPVADDVAEELLRLSEGREFVVPGDVRAVREDVVGRELSGWIRAQGWKRTKTTHCLRAFRQQRWLKVHDPHTSEMWVRHEIKGVAAHYLSRVVVSRRPLGLGE